MYQILTPFIQGEAERSPQTTLFIESMNAVLFPTCGPGQDFFTLRTELIKKMSGDFARPDSHVSLLIWRMVRFKPNERITIEAALAEFSHIFPS